MPSAEWLRERFASKTPMAALEPGYPPGRATPAAVLIPVVMRPTGLTVLLTQRTAHLNDHAGQVSFPGGRAEESDAGMVETALRESWEEVGLDSRQIEVIGTLPEFGTGSGFLVTPVMGLITPPLNLKLDDFEVAEVFEPPLDFLLDPANWQRGTVERDGRQHQYWAMPWQGYYIWGITAAIIVNLRRYLIGAPPP